MIIFNKMKFLLPALVIWLLSNCASWVFGDTPVAAGIGYGIKREIFFLNLEDGYFGCQVNQSTDVLQLYELSRLCDGRRDCFQGSDELRRELKCTDNCLSEAGIKCQHGVCLDSQCHCNDGFGGCSCEVPDENECKYRPCDVFAHCTNTLGGFHCSCFPGYTGDGFHCHDINECDDPAIASRCVPNAECCNVPAHFVCKCKPGFEGDGEIECRDIDECRHPNACGHNALCYNTPGNYTCECKQGFAGNPFLGCSDFDECTLPHACGPGAKCNNFPGGYHCECPPGYTGDAYHNGCVDINECLANPCGKNALCKNVPGSFKCSCPAGSVGDPFQQCTAIGCTSDNECDAHFSCISGQCENPCQIQNPCQYHEDCEVKNHRPICVTGKVPQPSCDHCPPGVPCDPTTGACAKAPGTAKRPQPCQLDTDCLETEACYNEECEDLCSITNLCAPTAKCHVVKHRPVCTCPPGYQGNPAIRCYLPKTLNCFSDVDCAINEVCIEGTCQQPCSVHNPCAQNAVCINTNHGADCSCIEGYQGNGFVGCKPVEHYQLVCQYNEDCPPDKLCDRLNRVCISPCFEDSCGENAECVPKNHGTDCRCLPGYQGNPYVSCGSVKGCRHDNECAPNEACINGKCNTPCRCGLNAVCEVFHHKASCKCLPGYTGNPATGCLAPQNPCDPNPCGLHALCELDNGNPICFCPKGMTGNPFTQCIPEGDECTPNPCGPNSGCRVVHGSAVCFCLPEYEGDPPITQCRLPKNPCQPSPCGPNTQCTLLSDGFAKCTCLPGYVESPNTVRGCVEKRNPCDPNPCGFGAICDSNRPIPCFCPEPLLGNPYKQCSEPTKTLCQPGPCGNNADCYVTGSIEQCYCKPGYQGDPYISCKKVPINVCTPNPCGPHAACSISSDGHAICTCPPGVIADPVSGSCSGLECTADEDCSLNKACVSFRCQDPCPGSCGISASCRVEKHHPVCTCNHGLTGNPLIRCFKIEALLPGDPCTPNPCGVNAYCTISDKHPVCSCLDNFVGDPRKGCYPECVLNTDCSPDRVCVNYRCRDPCKEHNICGLGAVCLCRDHTPTCICKEGTMGNPFIQCVPKPENPQYPNQTLPCTPSPCDPTSQCHVYGGQIAMCDPCSVPSAQFNPSCHPECLSNADCSFSRACLGHKCLDPCPGSCGINALCQVVNHSPVCSCPHSLSGNPYEHCSPLSPVPTPEPDHCHRDRCGANAVCKNLYGHIVCECHPGYYGNPYLACHPECVLNTDCEMTKACLNNKCVNPCSGVCGINAECEVVNHVPVCFCAHDYTGDPLMTCYPYRPYLPPPIGKPGNPCDPSPCGPNSRCLISSQGYATCSCLPGYYGSPPLCKPECIVSAECPQTHACVNQKCVDPCIGICGYNARCFVVNHNPICSCPTDYVGDPFIKCTKPTELDPKIPGNPCDPSPCGSYSICQVKEGHPVCSCIDDYFGSPPYCRPQCTMNQECPSEEACFNGKCRNPCTAQSCGSNAKCYVLNHTPYCSCLPGYEGDAFVSCGKIPPSVPPEIPKDPCVPNPCGENTQCFNENGIARCSCIPPYIGNPYSGGCRPECVINSDCPPNAACLSSHCRDPCPGVCGINAECTVFNHVPSCSCFPDYIGDPFKSCRRKPATPIPPQNPCQPSPCGPNSRCEVSRQRALCSCSPGFVGTPPNCRPECVSSAECNPHLACISQKCANPCPGTCGLHAICNVVNHNPICSCPSNTAGDPFIRCVEIEPKPTVPLNPCSPSPCGPNSECKVLDHRPVCSCIAGMLGAPPYCRPECMLHADCPTKLACVNNKCRDPCVGSCGFNSQCTVVNHQPVCACNPGFQGDPFFGCNPTPVKPTAPPDPCNPSPCGANAICKERNGVGSCSCLPQYIGDPYTGCRPECVLNSECSYNLACINNKCVDPCTGVCGSNAECRVINHAPSCSCINGYTGNPLIACHLLPPRPSPTPGKPKNPCLPSPCGPYSQCRPVDDHAVCSCQKDYIGIPPACRPECMVSSECPQDRACIKQKCSDPCSGICAPNARCQIVNHNPICSCSSGYTGDPFVRCVLQQPPEVQPRPTPQNPCNPSPCGPNSQCREVGNTAACSCLSNYIGRPPNCRPECTINEECPNNLACQNDRCIDPCPGSCGAHATCLSVKHVPRCSCEVGYTGDPFSGCFQIQQLTTTEGPKNPCNPSPCGANAVCKERNGAGSCVCLPEYFGDPYTGCRPECVTNTDCDRLRACVNNKCRDPCPGTCGLNAKCTVANHAPSCSCLPGYTGDPISACRLIPSPDPEIPKTNPCLPSPCGPYSQCRPIDGHAVCSCQNGYIGTPPACRPECIVSSECAQDKACINQKCADPCVGTCGINARCQVINHNPICSCALGYTGNPFVSCLPIVKPSTEMTPSGNPCVPSPCGPYSECRLIGSNPACSCLPNYIGRPPNCRPECTINEECAGNLACQNEKCRDPCPGSCGLHTVCVVVNHAPQCTCESGFTGDPFAGCTPQIIATTEKPRDPCNPSPCGANAVCKERNGVGSCVCLAAYFGDPYTGCRPECVTNSDCDRNKACLNNKCQDPCPGTCGLHAECRVTNHAPICYCLPGYTGDPISSCVLIPSTAPTPIDPCDPSPCGPNSICKEINLHAVCSCITGFIGTPPLCRPECVVSSECAQDKACMAQKCDDPCPGRCGRNSRCQVVNHNPICSCSSGFTGDPFTQCSAIPSTTIAAPPDNPCKPSPCGPYSQCRVINNTPACSCLNNYVGQPPNCRPECVIDAECPANRACKNERCSDPCPGSCGQSAICSVIHHNPTCSCPPGYTGDALVACFIQPTSERTPDDTNPCIPSPCGVNAECINRNNIAACKCIDGYFGDPYTGCRRECETNNDCALPLACVGYKCLDPCPGTCGTLSICTVVNHVPICSCPPAHTGDPFFSCKPIPISTTPITPRDPCFPSPCGPNSQCKQVNQQAVCTCMPNYMGPPPHCRPECIVNSECPLDKACINQRCSDPCPNTCGLYAQCNVKNHSPFCSCPPQFTGDPFLQCSPIPAPSPTPTEAPPSCVPSPCGPNSQCKIIGGSPVCSCLPDYVGSPPSCRPECVLSSECASQLACINQHCKDPCPGSCGVNAVCHVLNHIPVCTCIEDHTGDPFALCSPIPITTPKPQDPCNPSPCGPNAVCHADGSCECLPEYTGNPYEACRPECVLSIECSRDKACIRNKCQNPCPGTCGQSANCDVINHIPVCSCPPDMTGDPFTLCKPVQADKPHPVDPCNPSPCGPNSQCRQSDGHAVCSCLSGYIGTPPSCRPECIANGECSPVEACVNMKCINPCIGSCGIGARCEVINHSPICSCREGQTGDPFRSCYDIPVTPLPPPEPDRNPCIPSPCGPNSVCQEINKQPSCSCLQDYVGLPPNCRPECIINPDCPRNQACINNKCRDPCPGSCGLNAVCQVISHAVSCTCSSGFTGNPFEQCSILKPDEPINPCEPSPCGANAICKQQNGVGSCTCIPDYQGNPYEGCRPECVLSADCPADKACIRNRCQDPCPGICGVSATCSVVNHIPTCICIDSYEGDPFVNCHPKQAIPTLPSIVYPCRPSPCGPNSNCRENNGQAVCSCLPDFQGFPPDCKPECVVNSECPTNRACYKYKCSDPCPGTCGLNGRCEVINHHPICSCPPGFTGDPFYRCYQMLPDPIPPRPVQPTNPCVPSPCGPNSECHVTGLQASCRCIDNYIGAPPNCRPECSVNTDCSPTLACISEKCRDPCIGSCGVNAECHVQNHIPICSCLPNYTGDSFTQCSPIIVKPAVPQDPCNPSPCGLNADCKNGICTCINNYFGDPYVGCRPECTLNTDCSPNKACINQRCIDPCPGTCGQGAKCEVVNHIPTCTCPPQTTGDAFTACRNIPQEGDRGDPCKPSPCGPNSVCQVRDNHAVCSCQSGLIGSPPSCRPECITSAECQLTEACLMNKCRDPCPGTCGLNARCQVVNHNPICSCPQGYNGDPFRHCQPVPVIPPKQPEPINPCLPSPCGPNSVCQIHGESPACSCLPNYIGLPPNCRPECTINPECPNNLACVNQKCTDPCIGSCGSNAVCSVVNHIAVCSCIAGYNGDPFSSCTPAIEPPTTPKPASDPCYPSPCGSNARCRIENSFAVCECLPEFQGNPYEGCRPECLVSSDCAMNKACIKNKCQDPCPATCGFGAICTVSNHIPICYCPEDKTGDAFHYCEPIPRIPTPTDPCVPSPCGPNTRCQVSNNYAVCECLPGFQGSPSTSGCRPECVINSDCSRDKACVNNKCIDPCPGVCGYRAACHTINHSPICSCPSPLQGDPFSECRDAPVVPVDPCNPSPCRQDGQCRIINGIASCIYPECVINQDCPRDKACFTQKCKDPCVGACGINAICQAVNHEAVCSCPPGYYGQPKLQCRQEIQPEPKPECLADNDCPNNKACINKACRDPCRETTNVCASNAECRTQQHRPYCFCKDGLTGDAHTYCYEIGCRTDTDCLPSEACVNRQCTNPCMYTQCGINALCRVDYNHKARCYCPDNYDGNPLISCERPQCITDSDCPAELACQNQKCQNPCSCAPSALCTVNAHLPSCSCPPGYTGNPQVSCTIEPLKPPTQCKTDADCASKLACFNGVCRNPCTEAKPCGLNADCTVVDTLPLRTMTCLCRPGYVGDADFECKKEPQHTPGCGGNEECASTEICVNRQCVNPCAIKNPCASTANCQSYNHKAVCKCPEGFVGDPFVNCYKVPVTLPECTADSDCPTTRACINNHCQIPCEVSNPCGQFAECTTVQHRPICNCPDGWAGSPQGFCYKPECETDNDCLYDKACRNKNCVNPCATVSCGVGAECEVRNHVSQCVCPIGTQGNPLLSCVSVGCQYNEDCADHEICDRLNRKCYPVCEKDSCAAQASCTAKEHQKICTCLPGTQGNPYVECIESRVPITECTKDTECPTQLACINRKCQNPCSFPAVCSPDQECQVQDTHPVRTVMCICPPDSIASDDGHCKPIVPVQQCQSDNQCPESERCVQGRCIDVCKIDPCGLNALCIQKSHQAVCLCPPGYTGNAHIECSSYPIISLPPTLPECVRNDDCSLYHGCINEKCINPCSVDNVCGKDSFCHVESHQPECRCPIGYEGNPKIKCIPVEGLPITGCVSNSECASHEACVNNVCVNPCNCGPNAQCHVFNHYPMCYCKPGFSGNPQFGCVKVGCETDDQCAYDKVCYNGDCINPCIVGDPCAINAQCYGDNHRAACRCPSGHTGDPFIRCEIAECHIDADCPSDKACLNQHCVNPCTDVANPPCASNAICYTRNHAAGCRCPDYLPLGNPLSYCEKSTPPSSEPECKLDVHCPSKLACIENRCVNPCTQLSPCPLSSKCTVLDSIPIRTLICTCPEGWVPDKDEECRPVIVPKPPGCISDNECSSNETCVNRLCRNPCNCGLNAQCFIQNHRPICSCKDGYEGNPNIVCRSVGCKRDSECESGKACINGNCVNPCTVSDPCGPNAECFAYGSSPQCRCVSGYRGNPYEKCTVIGCRSNNDCPPDRACNNAQCINPCFYGNPCSPEANCNVKNHLAICRCPSGMTGNPYTSCHSEPKTECKQDSDCPQFLACFNERCQNPCSVLEPCQRPAECEVVNTLPVRTMLCVCPSGYVSSGSGTCKPTPAITAVGCLNDKQCPEDRSCVRGVCINPCDCGLHAECYIKDHKPVCVCAEGYEGNPNTECIPAGCKVDSDCSGQNQCVNRKCVPACAPDRTSCGRDAICYGINHRAICECPPGLTGNPLVLCTLVTCKSDSDCPSERSCENKKCVNPCERKDDCVPPAVCIPYNHRVECSCPTGYIQDITGCKKSVAGCKSDSECPSQIACINNVCVHPCESIKPCAPNAECKVFDTTPVKTMTCDCLPGFEGDAAVRCIELSKCATDKGFIRTENGDCICPPGTALNTNNECRRCVIELGYKVDESGHCVCALDRGLIINERGQCVCLAEHGYVLDYYGNCVPIKIAKCESNDTCADDEYCNTRSGNCENPCESKVCGVDAYCRATDHRAVCVCIDKFEGNPEVQCHPPSRKQFPRAQMNVNCLADGIQVQIKLEDPDFDGVLYVKGYSKDEECRRIISVPRDTRLIMENFKVNFGTCGLIHINQQASFILVVQKHPTLVTYRAQAYHIKCVYTASEQNITIGFNVSMLTTAGTIANTGPPPTCSMKIVTKSGQEISTAEIGENLMLQVDVQPSSIYSGFARSCIAKTTDNNVENEYIVTDENGCATDPAIFGEWGCDTEAQSLVAEFNAFKFPTSDNIRFQCNIRVCFGKCQPVKCKGYNAYGRRKREISGRNYTGPTEITPVPRGHLREEITIESNAILTFERKESRLINPTEQPQTQKIEDICISIIGLITALIITALLALVAVAVAVSCWLMAFRKRPQTSGPLPHPPEFPNPIFASNQQLQEPSPDYMST